MKRFFLKTIDKLICLDHIEVIIKSIISLCLLSLPSILKKFIFVNISYETLLYFSIGVLIYTFWKAVFFYKIYKGTKYAGLVDFNEHSNPEETKKTDNILADQIYHLDKEDNKPYNADEVDILLATGFDFFKNENRDIPGSIFYALLKATNTKIRVLLLDPDDKVSCTKRWQQIKDKEDAPSIKEFRENILVTIKQLNLLKKSKNLEYKLYNETPIFKVIRIDNILQIRSYIDSQWSFQTACFGFNYIEDTPQKNKNPTSLYVPFSSYFNELYIRSYFTHRKELRDECEENVKISFDKNGNGKKIEVKIVEKSETGCRIACQKIDCNPCLPLQKANLLKNCEILNLRCELFDVI